MCLVENKCLRYVIFIRLTTFLETPYIHIDIDHL